MSTADLAVIGMAVVSLASITRDYKVHMKVADRLRLVNPPKDKAAPASSSAQKKGPDAGVELLPDSSRPISITGHESHGEVA